MKICCWFILSLVACGPVQRDEALLDDFEAINAGYRALAGRDLPATFGFRVDDAKIEDRRKQMKKGVAASYFEFENEVVMPSKKWWEAHYHLRVYRSSFAHEIGHAMGLEHSETGLMMERGDPACVDREGECLFIALGGVLP